jgi:thioredoxin 1
MKASAIILLLTLAIQPARGAEGTVNTNAPASAAWLARTPAVQILDVRTKEEFATGHIAKARLIPWTDTDFRTRAVKELDPEKPVLVYCHSGGRSAEAAAELVKLGFKEVRNLEGGILGWQQAANPVTKPK